MAYGVTLAQCGDSVEHYEKGQITRCEGWLFGTEAEKKLRDKVKHNYELEVENQNLNSILEERRELNSKQKEVITQLEQYNKVVVERNEALAKQNQDMKDWRWVERGGSFALGVLTVIGTIWLTSLATK